MIALYVSGECIRNQIWIGPTDRRWAIDLNCLLKHREDRKLSELKFLTLQSDTEYVKTENIKPSDFAFLLKVIAQAMINERTFF